MVAREAIVAEARRWEGTPFRHQGRGPEGLDCAGLLVVVAQALGIPHQDDCTYRRIPDTAQLKRLLLRNLTPKRLDQSAPGDLLLFKDPLRQGHMYHLGIQTDRGFIHAYGRADVKRVVEMPLSPDWEAAIVGVFEYPEVEPWLRSRSR